MFGNVGSGRKVVVVVIQKRQGQEETVDRQFHVSRCESLEFGTSVRCGTYPPILPGDVRI